MNLLLLLFVVTGLAVSVAGGVGDVLDEYDWIGIAKDDKKFQRVIGCLVQDVPCDNLQKLKENGIKLFKSNCADCTPAQKDKLEQYKSFMLETRPNEYKTMLEIEQHNTRQIQDACSALSSACFVCGPLHRAVGLVWTLTGDAATRPYRQ